MKCFYFSLRYLVVLILAALAQAQTFTTLYKFTGGADGGNPEAGVIQDAEGNLYGTTQDSGVYKAGVVYEISTAGTETVLHSFGSGQDGLSPFTPVIRDGKGNIYGTTVEGGSDDYGTIFTIDATGHETILHSFGTIKDDGCYPEQGLVMGKSGILFGTAAKCGSHNRGTIFKVNSAGHFTLLYSFIQSPYGGRPAGGRLTRDKSGSLYGVTTGGGHNEGVLYELAANGAPGLLHSFMGGTKDGCYPVGSVMQDEAGNFYGTTYDCGSNGYGTIWKVSKTGREIILHNFSGGTADGCYPSGGVARDLEGNLYGVASECGANGYGALYEFSASGTFTLLHSFGLSDGADPVGEVLWTNGTLFGTTYVGGNDGCNAYGNGCGTVWSYVP